MKVHIGVPAYGAIEAEFLQSIMAGALICQAKGIDVELDLVPGCSLIAKARNLIVKRFLDSDADCLFFLDTDIEFSGADFYHMILRPEEVIGGAYVKKDGQAKFVLCPVDPPVIEDGVQEVLRIGTGFLRIRRDAFARLDPPEADGMKYYFNCGIRGDKYWGEDYAFCEDYRSAGGRIWLYPCLLGHVGKHTYRGRT